MEEEEVLRVSSLDTSSCCLLGYRWAYVRMTTGMVSPIRLATRTIEYGLMKGCDADTVDGKHANAFAPSTHEHSASQITSGNLPIERGGTGSGTAADACKNLGAMRAALSPEWCILQTARCIM